jgi:Zn-dependent protease
MIPFPPLDGSKALYDLSPRLGVRVMNLGASGIILALLTAFFLLPSLIGLVFRAIVGS